MIIKVYPRLHVVYQGNPDLRWYMMWEASMILRKEHELARHMWLEWGHFTTEGELWAEVRKRTQRPDSVMVETADPAVFEGTMGSILAELDVAFNRPPYITLRL